ncbi:MAG: hypothetical protein SFZ23_12175 [Planctomycetota bacterium]|nr:hypothetical protein [Planctomycetota bacterium]
MITASGAAAAPPTPGASPTDAHAKRVQSGGPKSTARGSLASEEQTRELARLRIERERELKKIRATYFGAMRSPERRREGLGLLKQHADPAGFQSMIDVFEREGPDVRAAVLEIFAKTPGDAGVAALAWAAIMSKEEAFRDDARARLQLATTERAVAQAKPGPANSQTEQSSAGATDVSQAGQPPRVVLELVAHALRSDSERHINAAAQVAQALNLYQLIPLLIPAQVGGATAGVNSGSESPVKAYIYVVTQTAFVSDLTPVVAESTAAFDPEVDVLSQGSILKMGESVITTHRTIVHTALVDLSSNALGQDTRDLGYDQQLWAQWYQEQYLPWAKAQSGE